VEAGPNVRLNEREVKGMAKMSDKRACKGTNFDVPAIVKESGQLPSLTHICSYAGAHTHKSTTRAKGDAVKKWKEAPPT